MSLHPHRDAIARLGREAQRRPSPFSAEAEAALATFRDGRLALERRVRVGEITPRAARREAGAAAESLEGELRRRAEGLRTPAHAMLTRLAEARRAREGARAAATLESLQRETNRLLRQSLVEQQIVNRAAEFEGRAFVRPLTGGAPAPTLETLLALHGRADLDGDEAAREWARRQLEGLRPRVLNPEDLLRIERATDRPDRVSPALVGTYAEAFAALDLDGRERFVAEALAAADSTALCAAFGAARDEAAGTGLEPRWARTLLAALDRFPDAALAALHEAERAACDAARAAAAAQADYAAAVARTEAELADLVAPTEPELRRRDRARAAAPVAPGEPIGLTARRRGLFPDELAPPAEADADGPAAG
jgi:hypothetical protein